MIDRDVVVGDIIRFKTNYANGDHWKVICVQSRFSGCEYTEVTILCVGVLITLSYGMNFIKSNFDFVLEEDNSFWNDLESNIL